MENEEDEKIYQFEMKPLKEIYYNEAGFFSINEIATKTELPYAKFDEITGYYITTLIGRTIALDTAKRYNVSAKIVSNEKYGKQYQIVQITPIFSEDVQTENNNAYLKAMVTDKYYKAITSQYSDIISLLIQDNDFEPNYKLLPGIGKKVWARIKDKLLDYIDCRKIFALLTPLGITNNMINKLLDYEPNVEILKQKLKNNPYEFIRIQGFGFMTVDKLALKLNPDLASSAFRVNACTRHVLEQQAQNGNLWLSISEFGKEFSKIISPNSPEFAQCFAHVKELIRIERELTKDNMSTTLHVVNDMIGLQKYYKIETEIWENLKRLNEAENFVPDKSIEQAILETNEFFSVDGKTVELTEEQISAIQSTRDNKVVIITANAGCGKTTCIKGILNQFEHYNIVTAALSGKAARRIEDATHVASNTIHKILEWNPRENGGFLRNESNPLMADMVILDECSMIDDILFLSLLKAIPDNAKLVLVFDDAQLSPIGAGSPAKDLLSSPLCINKLTKIHRQAENSGIKIDANKIRQNQDIFSDKDGSIDIMGNRVLDGTVVHGVNKDMEITMYSDAKMTQELMFTTAFNKYFELLYESGNNVDNVTIVVPRKDGTNSTRSFNEKIQEKLLGHEKEQLVVFDYETKKNKIFKKGARVIQRRVNDYERNVMNGEIGMLIGVNDTFCTISFDNGNKIVNMPSNLMCNMELAYAITVHSMQGSECSNVIILLDNSHYILLDCALFYTAVTRAQDKCVLLMQPSAYKHALYKNKTERRTYLKEIMAQDL